MALLPDHPEIQAKRLAARANLTFHIDHLGFLTTHAGHKRESRPATEAERTMWGALVGEENWHLVLHGGTLDATPDELAGTFYTRRGYVYMSPDDTQHLHRFTGFEVCSERELILAGVLGWLDQEPPFEQEKLTIYVNRDIPKGYVVSSEERIRALHWRRPSQGPRIFRPGVDPSSDFRLEMYLEPLMVQHGIKAKLA